MLKFAIEYRLAISTITAELDMKLRDYELRKEEWKVAEELCEVLKVCYNFFLKKESAFDRNRSLRMPHYSSLGSSQPNILQQILPQLSQPWIPLMKF